MTDVVLLLRLDTEDFLTAESDDAALWLAETLRRAGVRATFPLTAWKLKALLDRGRTDVLSALAWHSVGFHSTSHSVHPTIAEELALVADGEAAEAFRRREEEGARLVAETFHRGLSCYTQPGANWVAEATPLLRQLGIPLYYSEAWNGYVDVAGRPFHMGGVLQWAGPVAAPKPFLARLPEVYGEAVALLQRGVTAARNAGRTPSLVGVVTHPTELVTREFWDVVNFGRGEDRPRAEWRSAPLRPRAEVDVAKEAFVAWLEAAQRLDVEFWTAEELVRAFPDRSRGAAFRIDDALAVARTFAEGRLGSVNLRGVPLSAAEGAFLVAAAVEALMADELRRPVHLPILVPPFGESPAARSRLRREELLAAAAAIRAGDAAFPAAPGGLSPRTAAVGLARLLVARLALGAWPDVVAVPPPDLLSERYVKAGTGRSSRRGSAPSRCAGAP
jgi:hypothetical protein